MESLLNPKGDEKTLAAEQPVTLPDVSVLSAKGIETTLATITEKSNNAVAALGKIIKIESKEQDEAAEKLLVKVRNTYEQTEALRKTITSKFDELKGILMLPGRKISTDAKEKESEFVRVKLLRDGFATAEYNRLEADKKKTLAEQAMKDEKIRIKAELETRFFENVISTANELDTTVAKYIQGMTLENFDKKAEIFNVSPKLKEDAFVKWFDITYDKNVLPEEEFNSMMAQVKEAYTYDAINKLYQEKAIPKVDEWKSKLPARKKELEEIAELEKTNQEEADRKKQELLDQAEADQKLRDEAAKNEIDERKEQVNNEAASQKLDTQFETQVALQGQEDQSGIRKKKVATITGPDNKIVQVLAQVLFQCYMSPKFNGHIKKDKAGLPLPADANGRPIYAEWCETLLSFYAENSDVAIEGITISEVISTIQKAQK